MKRSLLAALAAALLAAAPAVAQKPVVMTGDKLDISLRQALQTRKVVSQDGRRLRAVEAEETFHCIINCADAAALSTTLAEMQAEHMVISDVVVTAHLTLSQIEKLEAREDVWHIDGPTQYRPFLDKARAEAGVDKCYLGTDLETPFTGKGVIIGVIDQGFEYRHAAFLDADNNPRTIGVWNRRSNRAYSTSIPTGGDTGTGGVGHATHVTGIAAGSDRGNGLRGVAPEADIIMVPSGLTSQEVVEDVAKIKQVANEAGKPWVVNMSFGGSLGPHDGMQLTDQSTSNLTEAGGILVGAMGNSGDMNLHTSYTFQEGDEWKDVLVDDKNSGIVWIQIWGQSTDTKQHLTVKPYIFANGKKYYATSSDLAKASSQFTSSVQVYNGKEMHQAYINMSSLLTVLGVTATTRYFGVEITADPGQTFHAWADENYCIFTRRTAQNVLNSCVPDKLYQVGEGAAVIQNCVAVGSYNTRTSVTNLSGASLNYRASIGNEGAISKFTCPGPMLQDWPKPACVAPGAAIYSAVSQYDNFDKSNSLNVSTVQIGSTTYYYQAMIGTSMSTPFVTGAIALWLQANPKLTYDDVITILSQTCRRDTYTDTTTPNEYGWDNLSGFGKIDVYEGLQLALDMANDTGIEQTRHSEQPVTLQKGADAWRILFNNDESHARITLYGTNGQVVRQQSLTDARRGQESVVNLTSLPSGVYLLRIQTEKADMTRKVVVR